MISIRQKLLLGFGGLLLIVAAMGFVTIRQIDSLGGAIDVILRQNYRSVLACQEMSESLDHIDSGVLFTFTGHYDQGMANIRQHNEEFLHALQLELGNITLPGEHQKAIQIKALFTEYTRVIFRVTDPTVSLSERQNRYFSDLLPLVQRMKLLAGEVLEMNQSNMQRANNTAWKMAASAHNNVLVAIIASAFIALLFSYRSHQWILMPIKKLIASAEEIRKGNLDLVLDTTSNDEIGQLSRSFNEMAATLRKIRKSDKEALVLTRKATQEVFKVLPSPIAVLDSDGKVEVSTESAEHYFGLKPGVNVSDLGREWLLQLWQKALRQGSLAESAEGQWFYPAFC